LVVAAHGVLGIGMAGQEGFEPTTRGFGIRCSTVGATDLETNEHSYLVSLCPVCLRHFGQYFFR
jgi:hypothetical protein